MITFEAFAADKFFKKDHPFTAKRMQQFIFSSESVPLQAADNGQLT